MRRSCYQVPRRLPSVPAGGLEISDSELTALADLLVILGCGEESAILAFSELAELEGDAECAAALRSIAEDERRHDALIRGLRETAGAGAASVAAGARQFYVGLGRAASVTAHMARIAALDAAVCTMLTRALKPGSVVAACPYLALAASSILRDEARHVRVTRALAMRQGTGRAAMADAGDEIRARFIDLLSTAGASLEKLRIDPAALFGGLSKVPERFFGGRDRWA